MKIKLPGWPINIRIERVVRNTQTVIQKNEFKVCEPVTREVTDRFGTRKRIAVIHVTPDRIRYKLIP